MVMGEKPEEMKESLKDGVEEEERDCQGKQNVRPSSFWVPAGHSVPEAACKAGCHCLSPWVQVGLSPAAPPDISVSLATASFFLSHQFAMWIYHPQLK